MSEVTKRPGRPSLSEHQKQQIRDDIINIARDLFVNHGYENTSMRKIAAQAGFAPTKIYYYFENKKEILRYFWEDISQALWNHCEPSEDVLAKPPIEILRHLMHKSVEYWLQNPKSFQLGIATQDHEAESKDNFNIYESSGTGKYIELLYDCVQRCIDRGDFRVTNKQIAAQVITLSIYGIYGSFYGLPMVRWEDKDELINTAIDNTLRGLQN
ncbi:TetR/AcrR family transcriptional regulator [Aliikangiella marina]|uniref:TetR/AcrR family transcriptional regulator n=1 Tax=Aliikangiella marina TaxID=1712262 RepID=UPI00163D6940|nr:TetR/AcrR family transcriptional regulator [Aliikangiella marina]